MAKRKVRRCACGDLGRIRKTKHKSMRGLGRMVVGTCKTWRTAAGTLMRGCMTAKGFRIKGKARG